MIITDNLNDYWNIYQDNTLIGWITYFNGEYRYIQKDNIYLNENDMRLIADELKRFNNIPNYYMSFKSQGVNYENT